MVEDPQSVRVLDLILKKNSGPLRHVVLRILAYMVGRLSLDGHHANNNNETNKCNYTYGYHKK
jgi:hypothetical protein